MAAQPIYVFSCLIKNIFQSLSALLCSYFFLHLLFIKSITLKLSLLQKTALKSQQSLVYNENMVSFYREFTFIFCFKTSCKSLVYVKKL